MRYGNMGEQILGLDVALPDGSVVRRHSEVRSDNTGYDLASLFVGAEGTLGVITGARPAAASRARAPGDGGRPGSPNWAPCSTSAGSSATPTASPRSS